LGALGTKRKGIGGALTEDSAGWWRGQTQQQSVSATTTVTASANVAVNQDSQTQTNDQPPKPNGNKGDSTQQNFDWVAWWEQEQARFAQAMKEAQGKAQSDAEQALAQYQRLTGADKWSDYEDAHTYDDVTYWGIVKQLQELKEAEEALARLLNNRGTLSSGNTVTSTISSVGPTQLDQYGKSLPQELPSPELGDTVTSNVNIGQSNLAQLINLPEHTVQPYQSYKPFGPPKPVILRAARPGEIINDPPPKPFSMPDLPFGDLKPDGDVTSIGWNMGYWGLMNIHSLDFVTIPEATEFGIFWTSKSPKANINTPIPQGETPQAGISASRTALWIKPERIREDGIDVYGGETYVVGGGHNIFSGSLTSSVKGSNLDPSVVGVNLGVGVSGPNEFVAGELHSYVTESKLLIGIKRSAEGPLKFIDGKFVGGWKIEIGDALKDELAEVIDKVFNPKSVSAPSTRGSDTEPRTVINDTVKSNVSAVAPSQLDDYNKTPLPPAQPNPPPPPNQDQSPS
jgi:hypothetical protein